MQRNIKIIQIKFITDFDDNAHTKICLIRLRKV